MSLIWTERELDRMEGAAMMLQKYCFSPDHKREYDACCEVLGQALDQQQFHWVLGRAVYLAEGNDPVAVGDFFGANS